MTKFNLLAFFNRLPTLQAFSTPLTIPFCCFSLPALMYFSFVFTISVVHQTLLPNPVSSGYQTLVGVQQPSSGGQPNNMGNHVQGVMVQYPPLQSYQVPSSKCT